MLSNRRSRDIPWNCFHSPQPNGDSVLKTFLDTAPCVQNVQELILYTEIEKWGTETKSKVSHKHLKNMLNTKATYAMACPSEVDVPRPSSSNATSECWVAEDCINHHGYVHRN